MQIDFGPEGAIRRHTVGIEDRGFPFGATHDVVVLVAEDVGSNPCLIEHPGVQVRRIGNIADVQCRRCAAVPVSEAVDPRARAYELRITHRSYSAFVTRHVRTKGSDAGFKCRSGTEPNGLGYPSGRTPNFS